MAKKRTWKPLKVGDLFGIYIDEKQDQFYVGQVVLTEEYGFFHMIVYDCICSSSNEIDNVLETANAIFFGHTEDSEFNHGRWKKFHNAPYDKDFPRPCNCVYKKPPPNPHIILRDFDGNFIRDATQEDWERYGGKLSVSPGKFTGGVKAFFKEGWDGIDNEYYEAIDIRRVLDRCKYENGSNVKSEPNAPEHVSVQDEGEVNQAIIVEFNYGLESTDTLFELEDKLRRTLEETGVGVFDGDEIAVDLSDGFLYLFGPDAKEMFKVIEPILKSEKFMQGAIVELIFGEMGEDVPSEEIELRF